jgi:hypothetical protein
VKTQTATLHHDLTQIMRRFGRQCRGQGKIFVTLVRQTEKQLLERGHSLSALAQTAQQWVRQATHLPERQRTRVESHLQAALAAHHAIRSQSQRLTHGKPLRHCKIVNAYDSTIAPILKGKSNCPAQFGRKPGIISEPTAGFIFATHLPIGNPSDASYVVPLVDKVQTTIARVKMPRKVAIHSVASDLGANDPTVRQILHARGILTLGIPKTVEPINPQPAPQAIRDYLNAAGLNRQRTPYQVQLACACGYSRPVVESHIATLLSRGVGQVRYKGPHGATRQLGMTVMAHNGATMVRIRQQHLSKRAQKLRRLLGLRRRNVNQINNSKT